MPNRFRRPRRDKALAQRLHAKRRARRYGLDVTTDDLAAMVWQIQLGEGAWFVKRQSNRVSHFLVQWGDQLLPVVYDRLRKEIVTFLPRCVLAEYAAAVEGVMGAQAELERAGSCVSEHRHRR